MIAYAMHNAPMRACQMKLSTKVNRMELGMQESRFDVDICVCTFRRPHVIETLQSISRLILKFPLAIRVIVADNDDTPSARARVDTTAHDCSLELIYLHAPARNISVARNACLDAATAPLVAFIDDDELASPGWLANLLAALNSSKADVVLGPVQAVYGESAPGWMVNGDFHSMKPVRAGDEIRTGYTSNVLFRRLAPALRGRRFRHELGMGGEDTMFFSEVYRAGGRIEYAAEALVTEAVPASRASMSWLLKRRSRCGQTHAMVLMEDGTAGTARRLKWIGLASAKAAFCFLATLLNCARAEHLRGWLLRGTLHSGVLYQLLVPTTTKTAQRLAPATPQRQAGN